MRSVVPLLFLQVLLPINIITTLAMTQIHTIRSAGQGPLCVLVHGLDSHSGTWSSSVMRKTSDTSNNESLSSPCLAIDQRGCGLSEDLSDETFSQDALVDDLYEIIRKESTAGDHKTEQKGPAAVILVGHSLGGRIALGYAAKYPETLAAVVVEDMDILPRPSPTSPVPIPSVENDDGTNSPLPLFQRRAVSKEELVNILSEKYNYAPARVDGWLQEGRIVQDDDGSFWSHVNPDFRRLCYQHVLSTANGRRDCHTIASNTPTLPCHVMVAGTDGTVCFEESIDEMKEILGDQLTVHRYPEAGHSVHSSGKKQFLETMEQIIQSVKNDSSSDSRL